MARSDTITAGIWRRRNGLRGQFAQQQSLAADVRFGSKPDIASVNRDVRFTPKSGHQNWPALRSAYWLRQIGDIRRTAPFTETLLVVAQATLALKSARTLHVVSAVFALGIAMTSFVVCLLYYHLGRSPWYW
jgi:hypothetical protein